jgi:hypothetical protein
VDAAEQTVVNAWLAAVEDSYRLAKGTCASRLRWRRVAGRDGRGVDPFSESVGRAYALQDLLPWLRELHFDPAELRRVAEADAIRDFEQEVREKGAAALSLPERVKEQL